METKEPQLPNTERDKAGICPVQAFAGLVTRIRGYNLSEPRWAAVSDRSLNLVLDETGVLLITAAQLVCHLRAAALQHSEDYLGFPIMRIGIHFLVRSGAAMAMFLAGMPAETGAVMAMFLARVPAEMIQLMGRWHIQSFLGYIQVQVQATTNARKLRREEDATRARP